MSRAYSEITRPTGWRRCTIALLLAALMTVPVAGCARVSTTSVTSTTSGGATVEVGTTRSAAGAAAQPFRPQRVTSDNWAGYVVEGGPFSTVSAQWVVPAVRPNAMGHSAFWVGLGGASPKSSGLEQVGTDSDYVAGHAEYYAWYEVLPAASVLLNLAIHPGDRLAANVSVDHTAVTISLSDLTTARSTIRSLQVTSPDTSSAEWIAEAPSVQTRTGGERVLPLADFGKVTFGSVRATAGGRTGTITNGGWRVQETQLLSTSAVVVGIAHLVPGGVGVTPVLVPLSGDAVPSAPTHHGSSFSVVWRPER